MSINYTINITKPKSKITIATMPVGSYGIDARGLLYFRTIFNVTCLSMPGNSFDDAERRTDIEIDLLPIGTKIEIIIEESQCIQSKC